MHQPVAEADCVPTNAVRGISSCIRLISTAHTVTDTKFSVSAMVGVSIPIKATTLKFRDS